MNRTSPRIARRSFFRVSVATSLLVGLVSVSAIANAVGGAASVDLRRDPRWLPYRFRTVVTMAPGMARERGWISPWYIADVGGDGVDDLFRANGHGICGSLSTQAGAGRDWQTNLPAAFARQGPCASVDGVWDLDGDGEAEVVSTAGTPDGFQWQVSVMDAATGAPRWSADLPAGKDERGDGNWDGFFRAFGPFTAHLVDGPRAALLVGIEAGHDERPRGVLALDARDGHELWRLATGAKPIAANIHLADLDGDGRQEICLLGAGVSNLEPGEEVDGAGDDHAMLFVLNDDGSLRWRRVLGAAPASGWVEPVDLGGDGHVELVMTAYLTELGSEALAVFDADGALLVAEALPSACHSLAALARGAVASVWLTFDGSARRYEISSTAITPGVAAVLDGTTQVALVADLVGGATPELVIGGAGGRTWMVDESLRPLALLNDTGYRALKGATSLRRLPDRARRLAVLGDPLHAGAEFDVERSPRDVPWARIVAGAAVAGVAGLAWRVRARRLSAAALRELRLQLLDRLELAGHGKIGSLSSAWNLWRVIQAIEDGVNREPAMWDQARALAADVFEVGLPNLEAVVEVAALADLEPEIVREATAALAQLQAALDAALVFQDDAGAPGDGEPSPGVRLSETIAHTNERFRRLRKAVEKHFSTAPDAAISRSLEAHADQIARLGVEVIRPSSPVPDCLVDQEDLAYVMDNLVENALRAMEVPTPRRLVIDWRPAGDLIAITVRDSGVGMTAAAAEAALEPGEGKRTGGGRGLPGSSRRLVKYEGRLSVGSTAPGQGTTMFLHLRPAARGETSALPGSTHEPERS